MLRAQAGSSTTADASAKPRNRLQKRVPGGDASASAAPLVTHQKNVRELENTNSAIATARMGNTDGRENAAPPSMLPAAHPGANVAHQLSVGQREQGTSRDVLGSQLQNTSSQANFVGSQLLNTSSQANSVGSQFLNTSSQANSVGSQLLNTSSQANSVGSQLLNTSSQANSAEAPKPRSRLQKRPRV